MGSLAMQSLISVSAVLLFSVSLPSSNSYFHFHHYMHGLLIMVLCQRGGDDDQSDTFVHIVYAVALAIFVEGVNRVN